MKKKLKNRIKMNNPFLWNLSKKVYQSIQKNEFTKMIKKHLDNSKLYLQLNDKIHFKNESIVLITLDSLRYDVTQIAETPNFNNIFKKYKSSGWHKVGSHGTYTLPSHISMFHAGLMPCDNNENTPAPFNRNKEKIFKAQLAWERTTGAKFPTPAAKNIIKGFEKLGFRTIGIGGVHWFNNKFPTSNIWYKKYFKEFYWKEKFSENNPNSLTHQIELIEKLKINQEKKPVFLFLNISSTHKPYMGFEKSILGQKKALEEVDKLLPKLLLNLPKRYHLMVLSDHGECFGEDNLWGHGFYHPKIMEVPFACVDII
ncbi:alkaline phosphatase family protein [Patescibacteria group bacterium]|nr:alkaline phosphatase family protein [Patescibacteria group bacterium]